MTSAIDIPPYEEDRDLIDQARRSRGARTRVYRPAGVMVVLGAGSRPEFELHLEACIADRVPLRRRPGGGCAVVLDSGNVVVAAAYPAAGVGGNSAHFERLSAWVVAGLAALGFPAPELRGASDLVLGDRKVGGACIWRSRDLVYYATTLLVAPDLGLMDRYLAHPPREPQYRRGRSHREFVAALADVAHGVPRWTAARLATELAGTLGPLE